MTDQAYPKVLIVGAGPVGMTAASELVRYGVSVRLIDKAAARTDKSKALVIWSRTLELLDRAGGAQPFIDAGFKANAVNIVANGSRVGRVEMDTVNSPYAFALMIPQSETERVLDERLGALGVKIERQVELARFTNNPTGVEAVLRHADGREESVQTDWLLGCDGAHSVVRHGLDMPFTGETMNSDWMLADVHMSGYPYPDTEVSVSWHRDGAFVIFPISPGRYRIIADLPPSGNDHPPAPTLEQVQAIITRRGAAGMKAFDPIWLASFKINGRKVARYRAGRAFVLGDAAHVHSPAGGQGMNTGMQDAFNLAWKLAMVIDGSCNERLLDSFSVERSAVGDAVLKQADRLTDIGTLKNPIAQTVRNAVGHLLFGLPAFQHNMSNNMAEVSLGYAESPLNGPSLGLAPKPGERVVPVVGQLPPGLGTTPRFALFAAPTTATSDLVKRFDKVLDPALRRAFGPEGLWLVRPDGYVACSTKDPDDIARYLAALA